MEFDFATALERFVDEGGSDLHLKVGNRPLIRVDGRLRRLDPEAPRLRPADTEEVLHNILPETKITQFEYDHEIDFSYAVRDMWRFRVNAYFQRGSISLVFRRIPDNCPTIEQLALPQVLAQLAEEERGIVLVTGSTGSGKSTTLAAMIDHMNRTMCKHVVTIEDPIEYLHRDAQCSIDQREVGSDTESFKAALRRVLRQDPDVILVGEMRDEETVSTALSAAETGHLVLSTLHTVDAVETINRILDFFGPQDEMQVRAMLAGTLKGIVSQRLVPAASGSGRVAICEVLRMTGRTHDMIMDPSETGNLEEVIATGEYYGMQTFDQALYVELRDGRVTMEDALRNATHPHDFKLLVSTDGRVGTSMEDLNTPSQPEPEPEPEPAHIAASVPPPR